MAMAGQVPSPRQTWLRSHGRKVVRVEQEQRTERAEFQVLKDQAGRYYWRLQAASNRIIAWSGQAYDSKYWCVQDVNWLRANAYLIMVYDYTGEPLQDGHTSTGTANREMGELAGTRQHWMCRRSWPPGCGCCRPGTPARTTPTMLRMDVRTLMGGARGRGFWFGVSDSWAV